MGFGPGFGPGFSGGSSTPPPVAGLSEAVFERLLGVGGITWYPLRLPDGKPPRGGAAGVYQRISSVPVHTHGAVVDLKPRRFQLTVYSDTYDAGLVAIRATIAALDGTRSLWGGWSVSAMVVDEAEDVDPDDRGLFRQRVDVMLSTKAP